MRPSPNGFWLSVCIAKVIGIFYHRVASMPRLAFEGLELCDGKQFLGGLGLANSPRLPGILKGMISIGYYSLITGLGASVICKKYQKLTTAEIYTADRGDATVLAFQLLEIPW